MTLISRLARDAGLSIKDVRRIVSNAPKRYKIFTIPKRNGGERVIAQPAVELKALQRLLVSSVLSSLPVHDSAFAYVRGRSIRQNALKHASSDWILKLDFENFFNAIRPFDLERVLLSQHLPSIDPTDFETIYQICFWGMRTALPLGLSVGAPSSPVLSNIVMYDFDRRAHEAASELNVTYTRYADDITVSSSEGIAPLIRFEKRVPILLRQSRMSFTLNQSKRGLYGRGERRMVTGLIITPSGEVSIGRERKRLIRAIVHRISMGDIDARLLMQCKGLIAFAISAEPGYLRSLRRTYGASTIRAILRAPRLSFYDNDSLFDLE